VSHNSCFCARCEDERRDATRYRWMRKRTSDMGFFGARSLTSWLTSTEFDEKVDDGMRRSHPTVGDQQ
jgi:hypothetical protein